MHDGDDALRRGMKGGWAAAGGPKAPVLPLGLVEGRWFALDRRKRMSTHVQSPVRLEPGE